MLYYRYEQSMSHIYKLGLYKITEQMYFSKYQASISCSGVTERWATSSCKKQTGHCLKITATVDFTSLRMSMA